MDDSKIVELYWARSQRAISESENKYGSLCRGIAYRILQNNEDAEECENDTYSRAWNSIPPNKPLYLGSYLGSITRHAAIDMFKHRMANKRGNGFSNLSLDELEECIPNENKSFGEISSSDFSDFLSRWLRTLSDESRAFFLLHYWFGYTAKEIAEKCGAGTSKVKMSIKRSRDKLRKAINESESWHE